MSLHSRNRGAAPVYIHLYSSINVVDTNTEKQYKRTKKQYREHKRKKKNLNYSNYQRIVILNYSGLKTLETAVLLAYKIILNINISRLSSIRLISFRYRE